MAAEAGLLRYLGEGGGEGEAGVSAITLFLLSEGIEKGKALLALLLDLDLGVGPFSGSSILKLSPSSSDMAIVSADACPSSSMIMGSSSSSTIMMVWFALDFMMTGIVVCIWWISKTGGLPLYNPQIL